MEGGKGSYILLQSRLSTDGQDTMIVQRILTDALLCLGKQLETGAKLDIGLDTLTDERTLIEQRL